MMIYTDDTLQIHEIQPIYTYLPGDNRNMYNIGMINKDEKIIIKILCTKGTISIYTSSLFASKWLHIKNIVIFRVQYAS